MTYDECVALLTREGYTRGFAGLWFRGKRQRATIAQDRRRFFIAYL